MPLSLVFNDLSLRRPAPDHHTARKWMTGFVATLKTAAAHNVTVLRIRDNFKDLALSPEYPLGAWFGDERVSIEERDFVLDYATRYSFIQPYDVDLQDDTEFQSKKRLFEGRFGEERAEGLGFAHLLNGLAISILSEPCWDTHSVELECEELDPESLGISKSLKTLPHASRREHVANDHASWIAEQIQLGIHSGLDLLENAITLCPNLVFCSGAKSQIASLTETSLYLPKILDRMLELEKLARAWEKGSFNYRQIRNASPESKPTMDKFGDRRRFVCPDGQIRTFEWHLKGFPNAWRVHILADPIQYKIMIGYVGRHLPTAKHPT
ncbi:MAG: hypothetical protein F4Y84_01170 [Caldilineaceae bacterium SB0665_bin_25]|nr:hypothetical protein [Caldilineaceae bacterium SB0665_bin_25]